MATALAKDNPPDRVLIVEDEIAIALELEACLRDAGFDTVGPAFDAAEAAGFVASANFDAAILDFGLIGTSMTEVMGPLVERQVPFLFMTGYEEFGLPAWVPPTRPFTKPFPIADLVESLKVALKDRQRA